MPDVEAVYLDLRDLQSARVWRWLRAVEGVASSIEVRPFCLDVDDPWECDAPPFGLELLMLLEQARDHGQDAVIAVVDAAVDRITPDLESAHVELAIWLQIGAEAGLPLEEYDLEMERLKAEVGYWQAEAKEDHDVIRPPTLLFDNGSTVFVQLDKDFPDAESATEFLDTVRDRVSGVDSNAARP